MAGQVVDRSLGAFFWRGARNALSGQAWRPRQAWRFFRTVRWQQAAAKTRASWRRQGVPVPPIIIFSVTHHCNLQCAGCYARSFHDAAPATGLPSGGQSAAAAAAIEGPSDSLSDAKLAAIVSEADRLGVSFFVIAGGEPLLRPEILTIAATFPRILFLVFTNGVLVDQAMVDRLAGLKNVILLLSLEGTAAQTDERRGQGTHALLMRAMEQMKKMRVFFGCSLTLTSRNFSPLLDEEYVEKLFDTGCRFFLFADYTPTDDATAGWVLTDAQRREVTSRLKSLKRRFPALFIAVPWDEQEVGGCLSAGRGFVHISASGDVEPCPFSPHSDANLADMSLADASRSPFLAALRAMPELSEYSGGGCALWKNREEVERLLRGSR